MVLGLRNGGGGGEGWDGKKAKLKLKTKNERMEAMYGMDESNVDEGVSPVPGVVFLILTDVDFCWSAGEGRVCGLREKSGGDGGVCEQDILPP